MWFVRPAYDGALPSSPRSLGSRLRVPMPWDRARATYLSASAGHGRGRGDRGLLLEKMTPVTLNVALAVSEELESRQAEPTRCAANKSNGLVMKPSWPGTLHGSRSEEPSGGGFSGRQTGTESCVPPIEAQ